MEPQTHPQALLATLTKHGERLELALRQAEDALEALYDAANMTAYILRTLATFTNYELNHAMLATWIESVRQCQAFLDCFAVDMAEVKVAKEEIAQKALGEHPDA